MPLTTSSCVWRSRATWNVGSFWASLSSPPLRRCSSPRLVTITPSLLRASNLVAETEASEVNFPASDGYMGVLPEHTPLVAELGLNGRAACIVSGDTTGNSKPHPEPMLFACERAGR